MSEKAKKEEVPKFSYKFSLDQPFWIQQLTDNFALRKAVRLSLFAYFFLVFILLYFTVGKLIPYFQWQVKVALTLFASWQISVKVSDLRPDDKLPPVFLWDFIVYQFGYGLKAIEIYKGQKYEKVKLRSVEEFMEEE
ncbi:TcpE family conjugal transfer membrane protein [Lactococcus lactis]|uniref:TcpE family conjugal transfer membrane protein n=1 Tax=Lactococcus lactis subsp. lactis TaxID=1360 RepID=A0A1V0NZY9_LACLL|nr:TcpE family conjugal transfer membrane protein [Lactococcus lactis]ARE19754.2 TcpE family conjugal transfer membrane protein [Lactococcus lactis subsp. lactis]